MMDDATSRRAQRPRQADIARRSGVSVSTVSRVLAGEPGISEGVKALVTKAASDLGYPVRGGFPGSRPLPGLAGLRAGVLMPAERATGDIGPFYQDILDGLRGEADAAGFELTIRLLTRNVVDLADLPDPARADAVFIVGLDLADGLAETIAAERRPVVLVNGADPALCVDCVSPANFYGGRLATRTLLGLGHRRIAYIAGQSRHTIRERARGFRHEIAATPGAAGFEGILTFSGRTFEEAGAAIRALVEEEPGITAVFCMNDAIALGVLAALEGLGRQIPDDVSVLGFDDLPCATMMTPRLSTLRVDRKALAREAVETMRKRLADPAAEARQTQLAVRLVPGGTTGLAPGAP